MNKDFDISTLSLDIMDLIPVGILVSTTEGEFIYANRFLKNLLKLEDKPQRHTAAYYEDKNKRSEVLALLKLQKKVEDFKLNLKDGFGNIIPTRTYVYPITLGDKQCMLGFAFDETNYSYMEKELQRYTHNLEDMISVQTQELEKHVERLEQNEEELQKKQKQEESFNTIFSILNSHLDTKGIYHELLDILESEFQVYFSAIYRFQKNENILKKVHHKAMENTPDEVEFGKSLLGLAAEKKEPVFLNGSQDETLSIQTGFGILTPTSVLILPILYKEELLGIGLFLFPQKLEEEDVSYFMNIMSQLGVTLNNIQQYENIIEMAEELTLKTDLITRKNKELERASKLKSQFLANMSHELRTPLNAVIGFSEVLLDQVFGPLTEKQQKYIENILESGSHLLLLINDILDLSKVESGKMDLYLERIDISNLTKSSLMMIREKTMKHQIEIVIDTDDEIKPFLADERKVKQMLFNLLSNAAKFTPDKGRITIRTRQKDDVVLVEVEDTGIGISEDKKNYIFEEFRQADGSTARKYGGTGLGLSLVKKLVELHGGRVIVESELDKGSRFTLEFPYRTEDIKHPEQQQKIASTSVVSPAQKPMLPSLSVDNNRILIIEDDPSSRQLIRDYLQKEGYEIHELSSGTHAIEKMKELCPAIVILDIMLPGKDGWQILEEYKHSPELQDMKIIISSIVDDFQRGFFCGAADYVQKPLNPVDLLLSIQKFMPEFTNEKKPELLYIDDDNRALELMKTKLQNENLVLQAVQDPEEALEIAANRSFDLIIVDLIMPKISGFEVINRLRACELHKETPIIVLTSKELNEKDRRQISKQIAFLSYKYDFNKTEFLQEIHRFCSKSDGNKA